MADMTNDALTCAEIEDRFVCFCARQQAEEFLDRNPALCVDCDREELLREIVDQFLSQPEFVTRGIQAIKKFARRGHARDIAEEVLRLWPALGMDRNREALLTEIADLYVNRPDFSRAMLRKHFGDAF